MHIDNIKRDLDIPAREYRPPQGNRNTSKENLNLFSILKMESNENATHSAFLGELLNPKGSHLKGNIFLKLFLATIHGHGKIFDVDSTQLILEKYIGIRNDETKQGGRIDIYLKDKRGNSISIENKIFK